MAYRTGAVARVTSVDSLSAYLSLSFLLTHHWLGQMSCVASIFVVLGMSFTEFYIVAFHNFIEIVVLI